MVECLRVTGNLEIRTFKGVIRKLFSRQKGWQTMINITDKEVREYRVSESDAGFALQVTCSDAPVAIDYPTVTITKQANEHTKAVISGVISKDTYELFALRVSAQTDIKITYCIEGIELFLFHGIIRNLEVDTQGMGGNIIYELKVEALSSTCLMDIEKKSRSFQNGNMLYDQVLGQIMASYSQAVYLNYAAEGQVIGSFTMQYKETDWEFLKRMASRFYVPLIADHKAGCPRFSFGLTEGNTIVNLKDSDYKVLKEEERYREAVQNYNVAVNEVDYIYYEVKTIGPDMESLQVGDAVLFKNTLLYIISVRAEVKDYVLSHTYLLGTKNGLFCPPVFNDVIGGLSLQGTVIKVSRNMLKVHLDIDASQVEEDAHWFQYSTFYSTWYCMPEIGDRVNVHFPTVEESEGIVLNSVRQAASGSAVRSVGQANTANHVHSDAEIGNNTAAIAEAISPLSAVAAEAATTQTTAPAMGAASGLTASESTSQAQPVFDLETLSGDERVKMIATDSGKMLILDDRSGSVSIVCSNGTYITLSDSDGISIITDADIKLNSDKDINITAKEKITISAETNLNLVCGGSKIEVDPNQILVHGTDIKLNS